jgi:hypothetical protein
MDLHALPDGVLARVLELITPLHERCRAVEALLQAARASGHRGLAVAVPPLLGDALLAAGLKGLGVPRGVHEPHAAQLGRMLLDSRDGREPVPAPAPAGARALPVFVWRRDLWYGGEGAAQAARELAEDARGKVHFAHNKATEQFLATVAPLLGPGQQTWEVTFDRLADAPDWAVQTWNSGSGAAVRRGGPRAVQLAARRFTTVSAAKYAMQHMYERLGSWTELVPGTDDYAMAFALCARNPKVLTDWDFEGLRVGPTNTGGPLCLHFKLPDGQYSRHPGAGYAGLDASLRFDARTAAAAWDEHQNFLVRKRSWGPEEQEARTRLAA